MSQCGGGARGGDLTGRAAHVGSAVLSAPVGLRRAAVYITFVILLVNNARICMWLAEGALSVQTAPANKVSYDKEARLGGAETRACGHVRPAQPDGSRKLVS